jgi:hypothetical protein
VFLPGLMVAGKTQTSGEVPLASFVLIGLAPLLLALPLLPLVGRLPPRVLRGLRAGLVLAAVGVAVVLALQAEE